MKPVVANAEQLLHLIQRIQARDAAALGELYDHTSPILYGLLLRMLRRPDWAEEALQDCYLRVWQRAETYTPDKGEPIAWLIGIARYRGLDRLPSARERAVSDLPSADGGDIEEMPDHAPSPEDAAVEREGLQRLDRCLRGLQEEQRRSVLMAYYEGYSHSELALAMDAPLGTVKAWVRRGLARLRECLERP
ncbi:sigma-70 family RNA polymerase sigma factor [Panacagrimonas sp.]|uniref:sigma-70 family RNA polymerase sigma factor n=1 Tax=Panacagrimonas sp. TaxID=2480088 RepID=UPI003B52F53F